MRTQFQEPKTITDKDAVIRVTTEKGAVCLTSEQYDAYLREQEKERQPKAVSTPESSEN